MNKREFIIGSAIAGLVALGASSQAFAAKPGMEKCADIAKAGKNDCGTATSACAGTAKSDRVVGDWIYVPTGTCNKIAGGRVIK
jgi:uncharacterized membrane protein